MHTTETSRLNLLRLINRLAVTKKCFEAETARATPEKLASVIGKWATAILSDNRLANVATETLQYLDDRKWHPEAIRYQREKLATEKTRTRVGQHLEWANEIVARYEPECLQVVSEALPPAPAQKPVKS